MEFIQKKRVAGIVCEYNPFHSGHAWMIEQLRKNGVDCVVCVMSGPFVQRAEAAFFSTTLRAHAAVLGGADLVFRLPLAWSLSSAENFAYGAVGLLSALGCVQEVAFGAETAKSECLWQVATVLNGKEFQNVLQEYLSSGESFAAARAKAAESLLGGAKALLREPNNILGVEYCKALQKGFPSLPNDVALPKVRVLPRRGARHDKEPQLGIASASWLREQGREKGVQVLMPYVPKVCQELYETAEREGKVLEFARYEMMVLSRLRGMSPAQLAKYPAAGEGLESRLAKAAISAVNLTELYAAAKSKRFAHSRVRRLALLAALDVQSPKTDIPPFLQLLAASQEGLALLRQNKAGACLPLGTSLAKLAKENEQAAEVIRQEALAEDLYALCLKNPQPGAKAFTEAVQIIGAC